MDMRRIPLSEIHDGVLPTNADRGLQASLEQFGQIMPVIVQESDGDGGEFSLIAGRRRVRALLEMGATRVDAVVWPADRQEAAFLVLLENLQRRANPASEARAIRTLMSSCIRYATPFSERLERET